MISEVFLWTGFIILLAAVVLGGGLGILWTYVELRRNWAKRTFGDQVLMVAQGKCSGYVDVIERLKRDIKKRRKNKPEAVVEAVWDVLFEDEGNHDNCWRLIENARKLLHEVRNGPGHQCRWPPDHAAEYRAEILNKDGHVLCTRDFSEVQKGDIYRLRNDKGELIEAAGRVRVAMEDAGTETFILCSPPLLTLDQKRGE